MIKIISAALLLFTLAFCKEAKRNDATQGKDLPKVTTTTSKRPGYKNLSEVIEAKEILKYWAAEESYYPTLHFESKDTLWLEFDGQCAYSFPFKKQTDSIVVYWDLIEDCTHDIGIKKSFGLTNRPLKGKPFMTLRLLNDTTLRAVHMYKEWVNQFNAEYEGYKYLPDAFLSVRD